MKPNYFVSGPYRLEVQKTSADVMMSINTDGGSKTLFRGKKKKARKLFDRLGKAYKQMKKWFVKYEKEVVAVKLRNQPTQGV